MRLSKALKEKNRLANEVRVLGERLRACNSHMTVNPTEYVAADLNTQLVDKTDMLVKLKTRIAAANIANG